MKKKDSLVVTDVKDDAEWEAIERRQLEIRTELKVRSNAVESDYVQHVLQVALEPAQPTRYEPPPPPDPRSEPSLPLENTDPLATRAAPEGDASVTYRNRGNVMQKRALIAKYQRTWESIESCFKNAHQNGLHKAAKAPLRGEYFERDAVAWAKEKGNMKDTRDSKSATLGNVWG